MLKLLLSIFSISIFQIFSQEFTIYGEVRDVENNKPLPYVNIGFKNKKIGTLSNENGVFQLKLNYSNLKDTLFFYCSGYQRKGLLLNNEDSLLVVFLSSKVNNLPEVKAQVNGKWVKSKQGIERHFPGVYGIAENDSIDDIVELGIAVGNKNDEISKLIKINLYLQVFKKDTCRFRINFYAFKNSLPQERLNYSPMFINTNLQSGWFEVDLNELEIYFTDSIFIGIEFFPNSRKINQIMNSHTLSYGGVLFTNGICYKRTSSFDDFKKLTFGSYSIYATINSYKKKRLKK